MWLVFLVLLSGYLYSAWQMPEGTSWWWYVMGAFPFVAAILGYGKTEEKWQRLWFYCGISLPVVGLLLWRMIFHSSEVPKYGIETLLIGVYFLIIAEGYEHHDL